MVECSMESFGGATVRVLKYCNNMSKLLSRVISFSGSGSSVLSMKVEMTS